LNLLIEYLSQALLEYYSEVSGLMTKKLYLEDCYLKEFEAHVVKTLRKDDRVAIVLDVTAFYPEGGGQPCDHGIIEGPNGKLSVDNVYEEGEEVYHEGQLEGEIKIGDRVKGIIDWDRRYRLMRMHTAAHLLARAVNVAMGTTVEHVSAAKTIERGRLDFRARITRSDLPKIEEVANKVVQEGRKVFIRFMSIDEARELLARYGESVDLYLRKAIREGKLPEKVRVVEIEGWHATLCGGTHVKNTKEIGRIKLLKRESKGAGITRITFTVEP